jgi:hypothetical protein
MWNSIYSVLKVDSYLVLSHALFYVWVGGWCRVQDVCVSLSVYKHTSTHANQQTDRHIGGGGGGRRERDLQSALL